MMLSIVSSPSISAQQKADACLWKGTDVYTTGSTNSAGQITFNLSPTSPGAMYVTITKQNYLPYECSAFVISGDNNPPQTPAISNGPTTEEINIEYTYTTSTIDSDQDQVWYQWKFGSYTTPIGSARTHQVHKYKHNIRGQPQGHMKSK